MTRPYGRSDNPPQIRKRLRRNGLDRDVEMLIEVGALKPLDQWDLEELAHGRPRNKRGGFTGGKPKWLTGKIQEEIQRRLKKRAFDELAALLPAATKVLADTLMSPESNERLRFEAARLIFAYAIGLPKQTIDLESTAIEAMLAAALVLPSGEAAHPVKHPVIDGQVDDDDEDPPSSIPEVGPEEMARRRALSGPRTTVVPFRMDDGA